MNNLFFKTHLRLTFLYVGVILILLVIFSQILYLSMSKNILSEVDGNFSNQSQQVIFVHKELENLKVTLLVTDLIVLLVSSGASYFLALKTLNPIKMIMEQQKQFLSDASHELRTPLAVLQTNLENKLREVKINSIAYNEALNNLEEIDRMHDLVNKLLLLSRLNSSSLRTQFTTLSLNQIIDSEIKHLINYAKKYHVKINFDQPKANFFIKGDEIQLGQVFANVIKNAIDYNRKNGVINIKVSKYRKQVEIVIQDTGIGISKQDLPLIFHRFYKAEESRSMYKGSGLGLSITKQIIEKHRGSVRVESVLGKGTKLTISFPLE